MEAPALPADPIPTQDEKNLGIIMHVLSLYGFSLIGPPDCLVGKERRKRLY